MQNNRTSIDTLNLIDFDEYSGDYDYVNNNKYKNSIKKDYTLHHNSGMNYAENSKIDHSNNYEQNHHFNHNMNNVKNPEFDYINNNYENTHNTHNVYIPSSHYENDMNKFSNNTFSCLDIAEHVKMCPICTRFYRNDYSLYIILIVILAIICILLTKKVLNI